MREAEVIWGMIPPYIKARRSGLYDYDYEEPVPANTGHYDYDYDVHMLGVGIAARAWPDFIPSRDTHSVKANSRKSLPQAHRAQSIYRSTLPFHQVARF